MLQRSPATKEMDCRECGKPIGVDIQTVNPPRHFECGITAAVRAMREMHDKKGTTYDRYVNGVRAYAERIARANTP